MSYQATTTRNNKYLLATPFWTWIAALLILLLGFGLRIHYLEADAPLGVSPTKELSLDGPATIAGGRDKAVFGEWHPHPGPRQPHLMYPFMNWLAYGFFRLLGVGYWQANFISVVTGLLSVALVMGFGRRHFGHRVGLLAGLFTAVNYIYIIYNRDPMAYTTVACSMTLSLYTWGRGLRQPFWFFISGAVTLFAMMFIKLPTIAFLPAAFTGFLWLIKQEGEWRTVRAYRPLLLFVSGGLLIMLLWVLFLYQPQPQTVGNAYYYRTFSLAYGLQENIRFAVQSFLQFGVDYGFVTRLLPLFILAYGYIFARLGQLLSYNRPKLTVVEWVLLVYVLSAVVMLLFSAIRPLRFQIILIPLISLVAAISIERLWQTTVIFLPRKFGRLYPLFLLLGLTWFTYQIAAAVVTLTKLSPFQTGFVERWTILDIPLMYALFSGSLIISLGFVLLFIWQVTQKRQESLTIRIHSPAVWVSLFIGLVLFFDFYQYGAWMDAPQFSTVNAARQVATDFATERTVFGGPYAYALVLESDIPAIWLLSGDGNALLSTYFTHLVVESAGPLAASHYAEPELREQIPELFAGAILMESYEVRSHLVHVYELERPRADE